MALPPFVAAACHETYKENDAKDSAPSLATILNLLFELRLALTQCDQVTFEQGLILNALHAFKARISPGGLYCRLPGASPAFVSSAR